MREKWSLVQRSIELTYLRAPPEYSVGGTENYEKLFCTNPSLKTQSLTEEVSNVLDYLN